MTPPVPSPIRTGSCIPDARVGEDGRIPMESPSILSAAAVGLAQASAAAPDPAVSTVWAYVAFLGLVVVFLALDLGVFHREAHEVRMKEAVAWSAAGADAIGISRSRPQRGRAPRGDSR